MRDQSDHLFVSVFICSSPACFILCQNRESTLLFTSLSCFLLWLISSSFVFCFVFLLICFLFHPIFFSYWDSGIYYNYTTLKCAVDKGLNHCSSLLHAIYLFNFGIFFKFGFIYLIQYLIIWLFWGGTICICRLWGMLIAVTN